MSGAEWRKHVALELDRLGVNVERLPSGAVRLVTRHTMLTVNDIRDVSDHDLRVLAGR